MGGLNTLQLTLALRKHAQTARQFVGMFARDKLSLIIDEIPAIIIANTDPSTRSGIHWILFYFDNKEMFFDSLGKTLSHYHKDFLKFMKSNCNYYSRVVNNRIKPVNTTLCGYYCLYYAYSRCVKKMNKEQIINNMPSAIGLNVIFLFFFNYQKLLQNVNVVPNVCSSNKLERNKIQKCDFVLYIFNLFSSQHQYNNNNNFFKKRAKNFFSCIFNCSNGKNYFSLFLYSPAYLNI